MRILPAPMQCFVPVPQWHTIRELPELVRAYYDFKQEGSDLVVWMPCLDLVSVDVAFVNEANPYGEVRGGRLTVAGLVKKMVVTASSFCQPNMLHESQHIAGVLDCDADDLPDDGVYISIMLGCLVSHVGGVDAYGLILQKVTPELNTYRRVGIYQDVAPPDREVERGRRLKGDYQTVTII